MESIRLTACLRCPSTKSTLEQSFTFNFFLPSQYQYFSFLILRSVRADVLHFSASIITACYYSISMLTV